MRELKLEPQVGVAPLRSCCTSFLSRLDQRFAHGWIQRVLVVDRRQVSTPRCTIVDSCMHARSDQTIMQKRAQRTTGLAACAHNLSGCIWNLGRYSTDHAQGWALEVAMGAGMKTSCRTSYSSNETFTSRRQRERYAAQAAWATVTRRRECPSSSHPLQYCPACKRDGSCQGTHPNEVSVRRRRTVTAASAPQSGSASWLAEYS